MRVYENFCFDNFRPSAAAEAAYERIRDAGKGEEFFALLEKMYPDGISRMRLNEMLMFPPETLYETLGMKPDYEEEDDGYSFEERE